MTTLYRLHDLSSLRAAIKQKYLDSDDFEERQHTVGEREAVLVIGDMVTERARWVERVAGLIGADVEAGNSTSAAVLLIPGSDPHASTVWALCYGMGWLLLEQSSVDPGFGQRIAVRVADPQRLSSLTRKTMDDRAKIDRSSIPSGEALRGFGIGGFGELVTRLVADATIPGLTKTEAFKVRGADALSVPLGRTPSNLLSDLDVLEEVLARPAHRDLQVLEQLVAVKKDSDTHRALDKILAAALQDQDGATPIGLAWPHENVNENGTPVSFIVKGRGSRHPRDGLPTARLVTELVGQGDVLKELERIKIQLFNDADGDNPVSTEIPVRKWVAFETSLDGRRYFLHDGSWYLTADEYAEQLQRRVDEIFRQSWSGQLPPWAPDEDEEAYNKRAAARVGAVVLDRKLIHTAQNRRGFEACDILMPDGTLVHVKNLDGSSPASHLFAQGHNSAHALLYDGEARGKLKERVASVGGDADLVPDKPKAVVFAVGRKGSALFNSSNLYSFSKVTLVRTYDDLVARGIDTYVVPIANETSTGTGTT